MHGSPEPAEASDVAEPHRRMVRAGAALSTFGIAGTAVLGGLTSVVVARILGPADTGAYNVALAAFTLVLACSTLGINVGASFYSANRRWPVADAFWQMQLAALVVGLLAAGGTALIAVAIGGEVLSGVPFGGALAVLAAVPFALSWTFGLGIALARDRYELYAFLPLGINAGTLAMSSVLSGPLGVDGALVAVAAGHVAGALYGLWWGSRQIGPPAPGWLRRAPSNVRLATSFGIRSYATQVLQLLQQRVDLLILNGVAAKAVVGRYGVAVAVTELGILIPRALSAVVVPRLADLRANESGDADLAITRKSVRHVVLLMPVVALALTFAVLAIPSVFGASFSGAVIPGLLLIPGVLAIGLNYLVSATLIGRGEPRLVALAALATTPLALALYAVVVPRWGIVGAAVASSISYFVNAVVVAVLFRKVVSMPIREFVPTREEFDDYRLMLTRARPGT